ncbi:hypothetical protein L5515_015358 [Caenorhabditis briggsae]|uniref:Uncharacterized protein n=1 Tax=Caenorhabditis briggsae TaxID=6238 RepID=A0AAE9EFP3_CAEBR|nr:hypothetical protein L3Y34_019236 [Caenorhabditis briggsae]UMM19958.1 hypothetical protein L5515_015358 [Caenorhabditis briggsae]
MRPWFLLLLFIVAFSIANAQNEEYRKMTMWIIERQLFWLKVAIKENNYPQIVRLYNFKGAENVTGVIEEYKNVEFHVKTLEFRSTIRKNLIEGYLNTVNLLTKERRQYAVFLQRSAKSTTDWQIWMRLMSGPLDRTTPSPKI